MFRKIINWICSMRKPVNSGFLVVQNKAQFAMENPTMKQMVESACIDLERLGYKRFTSSMLHQYLDGLLTLDQIRPRLSTLVSKGILQKTYTLNDPKTYYQIKKQK